MTEIPIGAVPGHYAERQGGDSCCLTYPDATLSWAELDRRANQAARLFADHGVGRDDMVTVALPNTTLFHIVCFGLWKLGATPHIVSARLPAAELRGIVELAKPKLVIGVAAEVLPGQSVLPDPIDIADMPDDPVAIAVATHWKAMSSGGSTGRPKIIVDHNPAIVVTDDWYMEMPTDGCVLNPGPLYHNAPFIFAHYGLFRGNHLVGMAKFDAGECLELMARHKVGWVMMVPTMMHRIWRLAETERLCHDLSALVKVGHVAAPMPVWLKEHWIAWLGPERVFEIYGGTEATGVAWIDGAEWLTHKGSVGRMIRDSQVKILNADGGECAPGDIGEVYMMPAGGPASSYHYIGAEAKTADGGWESLGDMGWVDEDGYLYLADRGSDMIISGGANIYPAEVEAALSAHPGVDTAVVIGLPDADMGELVHALIYPDTESERPLEEDDLRNFVAEQLARYKTPRTYEFVEFALRDEAGKVRRSQLRAERIAS